MAVSITGRWSNLSARRSCTSPWPTRMVWGFTNSLSLAWTSASVVVIPLKSFAVRPVMVVL